MAKKFAGVLAISITALLFASCSGSSTQNTKAATSSTASTTLQSAGGSVATYPPTTTTTRAPSPPSTSTTVQAPAPPPTIEGFPLPPKALLVSGPTEKKSSYTGFVSTQATYSVPDMSSGELRSWYERNAIYRAAFGQYKWCESFVDGGTWDMWWRNSSSKTALGVSSLASNANAKGVTFSVSKETGDNTACR
jgi:hypothetical protein